MASSTLIPPATPPSPAEANTSSFQIIRSRIISGLLAALPLALTFFIVRYLYLTVIVILTPLIELVRRLLAARDLGETFWYTYLAPVIAVFLILAFLYTVGLFVRTRLMSLFDRTVTGVPVVGTIFKAVSNVSESLYRQIQGDHGSKRTVLVEFPHPGMKSLAFVTNTLQDQGGGGTILCVCVLTGVMPPSGFTLFVPEDKVVDVDWSMNQTLQAILSGGITAPKSIAFQGGPTTRASGPILDGGGKPVSTPSVD